MYTKLINYVYFTLRPLLKWLLHRFTCLCELQRICYGIPGGARRAKAVENSLAWSRTEEIKDLVSTMDEIVTTGPVTNEEFTGEITERAVETVTIVKRIKRNAHPDFDRLFETCVEQIWGYKRLIYMVESQRRIPYKSEDPLHERKLLELWDILMPETKLEGRITKQWQDIGFQV